jgi:hypothetical protein
MFPFPLLLQTAHLLERIDMDGYCEADQYDYETIFSALRSIKTFYEEKCWEYDLILYLDDLPFFFPGMKRLTGEAF